MFHHNTSKPQDRKLPQLSPLLFSAVMVVSLIAAPVSTYADQYDEQIKIIEQQKAANQQNADTLGAQAGDLNSQISALQAQIATVQAQIDTNTARQKELQAQIEAAQKKLEEQKDLLAVNLRSMYIEGDISPLEMIASSKNLGEFVDQQEYRDRIKANISSTMDEIARLKQQLNDQKAEVERIINEQTQLRATLDQKNAEAAGKLAQVNQSKSEFDAKVNAQSQEISLLQARQRAANASFFGAVGSGPACGGGYPGRWCNAPKDSLVDSWGMYNRECVSYAAFKVAASGRRMPYWGGRGHAFQWPGNARGAGISVDKNPRVGDIAIAYIGDYGHAMYVEAVNGNSVYVSEYNLNVDGTYTERWTSKAGMEFIHF